VTGNNDGTVKFYGHDLKISAWFEELNLDSIQSISFAYCEPEYAGEGKEKEVFKCAPFIVADRNAEI